MNLNQILRIICGIVILFSAFLHFIFLFADLPGCVLYYWIFGDPESMTSVGMFIGILLGVAIAFCFSLIHAFIYLIIGVLTLIFKKNKIVPSFSFILSLISMALGLRVIFIFGYLSGYLALIITIEVIILVLSIIAIITKFKSS